MMHAAVAIHRNNFFRAVGELEYIRKIYIELIYDELREYKLPVSQETIYSYYEGLK